MRRSAEGVLISLGLTILLPALLIEAAFGYPAPLFAAIRHPVVWMGALIAALDRAWNRPDAPPARRRTRGIGALLVLLAATGLLAAGIEDGLLRLLPRAAAVAVLAVLASSLFAQRSLAAHVGAVATALEREGLAAARGAVGRIVGRDTATLDEAAIARAAIESLAENFSDGVAAPALWCALGGLPGIALYKAINTADSMIGHRTPRHRHFGRAAAKLDDAVNLPASRLAAFWLIAAALPRRADWRGAARAVRRDAEHHRSPNAGWPEAAMAGVLGLRLAGPRAYAGIAVEDHWMGDGRADATAADIRRALRLYRAACAIQAVAAGALWLLIARG